MYRVVAEADVSATSPSGRIARRRRAVSLMVCAAGCVIALAGCVADVSPTSTPPVAPSTSRPPATPSTPVSSAPATASPPVTDDECYGECEQNPEVAIPGPTRSPGVADPQAWAAVETFSRALFTTSSPQTIADDGWEAAIATGVFDGSGATAWVLGLGRVDELAGAGSTSCSVRSISDVTPAIPEMTPDPDDPAGGGILAHVEVVCGMNAISVYAEYGLHAGKLFFVSIPSESVTLILDEGR